MKKGSFTPTREGYNRLLCTEDEDGNWRDPEGRLIYRRQGYGPPGSHVIVPNQGGHQEGDSGSDSDGFQGTAGAGAGHIAFSDPTFNEAWSNIPRRHPARCGVFQARLYELGVHRLQGMR